MELEKFLMVFLRVSVLIPLLPVFGGRMIPAHFKVGMILSIAYFLTPLVEVPMEGPIYLRIAREVLLGGAIGFSVTVVFTAVTMAAQWISFMMGLTMASVFDPTIGGLASPVAQMMNFMAIVAFFAFDLHHQVILTIAQTFDILPSNASLAAGVVEMMRMLFITAFKLAMPIILIELMANLTLGFIAKAMPQANLLAVGFPLNLGLGFLGLILFLPFIIQVIGSLKFIPNWR